MSELAKRIKYLRHLVMESAKVTTVDYFTVDELNAILAALEDAERYRWLWEGGDIHTGVISGLNSVQGIKMDKLIDAARRAER